MSLLGYSATHGTMDPPALGEKTKNSNSFKVLISQTLKQVCGLLDSWAGQTSSGHGPMNQHLFATNKRLKEEEGQGRGEEREKQEAEGFSS